MYQSNPDGDFFFKEFSPEIRDTSLFNGFNKILQRIEFSVGLAYGTISEPSEIEKTATEILTSKQRSYVFVSEIQRSLEKALQNLVYAINVYSTLVGGSQVSLNCTFGDSVLEDTEKEFQRRLQMVSAGLLSKEKFVSWYFNCDEKSAIGYIPQSESLFGG
jgi:A118 family predicted phage portal protein